MSAGKPKSEAKQFTAFVLVGGVAAAVNWGSRIALSAAGLQLTMAIVLAYVLGMVIAYVLSRRFVFETSGRTVYAETRRFAVVNLVALAQVWAVTVLLQRWGLPLINMTWHAEEVAHAIGVASPVVTSYFGHRYYTFDRKDAKADLAPAATEPQTKSPR